MSHSYLNKSKETYDSGEMLRSKDMYNSSIHCYYYSCMQMCNHIFHKKENLTDSEIRKLFSSSKSHKDTLNKLVNLAGLGSRKALTVDFSILKDKREMADYRNFLLNEGDSDYCKELCDNIMIHLKKLL